MERSRASACEKSCLVKTARTWSDLRRRGMDPPEHGEHDRDGFRGGLSGEPRGEGHAGFSFMQDEHRPRALADDEVAFPVTNIGAAFDVPWPIVDGGAVFDPVA